MFEGVLSGAAQAVEFFLALVDDGELGLKVLACLLVLVAGAGVFALLLVELGLALFELRLLALDALQALVGLLFGLGLDAEFLFAGGEKLVFHDHFRLAVGIVDYCFGARAGGGPLDGNHDSYSDGGPDEGGADVE